MTFAREAAAASGVLVHASLFERAPAPDGTDDGLGFNTAVLVAPSGEVVARTRKTAHPRDRGLLRGQVLPAGTAAGRLPRLRPRRPGARSGCRPAGTSGSRRSRARTGSAAQVLVYPTAIGSEPDHPDFDTQPLWQQVDRRARHRQRAVRRRSPTATAPRGSSPSTAPRSSPTPTAGCSCRPRDEAAVLVADLDLAQGRDWIDLFPFLRPAAPTRTPRSPSRCAPSTGGRAERGVAGLPVGWRMPPSGRRTSALDGVARRPATRSVTARRMPTRARHVGGRGRAVAGFEPVTLVVDPGGRRRARGCCRGHGPRHRPRRGAARRRVDARHRPDLRARRTARARRRRLGVQRLGRPGVGDVGRTPGSGRSSPAGRATPIGTTWSTRAAASTSTGSAPCCSPRPCSSTPAATPAHPGRRRGRAGPHHRGDDVHLAAARADPRLRRVRHPRARRHRRDLRVAGGRAAALAGRPGAPGPRGLGRAASAAVAAVTPGASGRGRARAGPETLEDDEGPVDWSYINHLVVNDGVVARTSTTRRTTPLAVLRAYAGRRVVGVDAVRCSTVAAASTASPSSSPSTSGRAADRRGHPVRALGPRPIRGASAMGASPGPPPCRSRVRGWHPHDR